MTAALTPHDLWLGVVSRAAGMAADYGAAFDQPWLARPGDPTCLSAAWLAVRRTLGLPCDAPSVAGAAFADLRTADELAEAYLIEYGSILGRSTSGVTASCPWCSAATPECVGGSDAVRVWFICSGHTRHLAWGVRRDEGVASG